MLTMQRQPTSSVARSYAAQTPKLKANGAVDYPWHGWQAGTDDDSRQAYDFVAAFEINPRYAPL